VRVLVGWYQLPALGGKGTNDMTETNLIINRHMARLLQNLEDAACPDIYRDAVKAALVWLRSDLNNQGIERHDDSDTDGNR
jgi:hypothetical protein